MMRNTLALVDPSNGQVTRVVAENVEMDVNEVPESSELKSNDELAEEWDQRIGKRAPVIIQGSQSNIIEDPDKIHTVVLMNKAGDALVTGSGWIANNMIKGGNALARKIQNGTRELETSITPAENPVVISEDTRIALEKFGTATGKFTSAASRTFDRAVAAAIKGVNLLYEQAKDPEREENPEIITTPSEPKDAQKLGQSALKAIGTVLSGTGAAAGTVSASARSAIVDLIRKKYGEDAGYVAARTLHATGNIVEMLIYFDARGIARQVVKRGTKQLGGIQNNDGQKKGYDSDSDSDLEHDRRMVDSPIEDKDAFENIEYPVGPPPAYPPRPSQSRKSVETTIANNLHSPTPSLPPPYPPRPTKYTLPDNIDQYKQGQKQDSEILKSDVSTEDQTPFTEFAKMHVDQEAEPEGLTSEPASDQMKSDKEPVEVDVNEEQDTDALTPDPVPEYQIPSIEQVKVDVDKKL
ncbi:senescence-associated protein-domain-containing protein [Umbelopsis sp. PMI_123]|nr:senescence-associated protein-domain-containing protein [Umbelopsis sp. PMI_123]